MIRLDGIGQACQRLPEDQGLIFPGGYYLTTGVSKTFDTDVTDLEFERVVRSPNGEDVLYVFHSRGDGRSLLLPYNVIRKEVANPIVCHGYSLFDDGTMVVFRATSEEPTRVHPMQVWQTPYVSDTYAAAQPPGPARWSASATPSWCAASPTACRSPAWSRRWRRRPARSKG